MGWAGWGALGAQITAFLLLLLLNIFKRLGKKSYIRVVTEYLENQRMLEGNLGCLATILALGKSPFLGRGAIIRLPKTETGSQAEGLKYIY